MSEGGISLVMNRSRDGASGHVAAVGIKISACNLPNFSKSPQVLQQLITSAVRGTPRKEETQ